MAKEFHPDVCFIYSVTEKEKNSLIDIPSWPTKLF
jgi:hypothetical protein